MLPTDPGAPPEQPGSPQAPAPPASQANGGGAPGATWQPAEGGPPPAPSVTLPKGGGAIRDIGEKFTVSAATGTASLAIPVATSPGRAGFGPSLSLTYDSGAGNGPFGLGWKVSLPAITRKTDKGLPRYRDDPDQDTFILSGAEDLVPVRAERDGVWEQAPERRTVAGRQCEIQCYRPRIEGLFARIERWRDLASGETHWRSITSGNVTTIYGATAASRIADPADPSHVFSWLICASHDDTGNAAIYDYQAEDSSGVGTALASERNRTERSRSAGRYPKRIRYGNRVPWPAGEGHDSTGQESGGGWMFEVVFDYGDHDEKAPLAEPTRPWPCRPDPFSTYRPGFEVRTYRRCHRILMFHHFPGEPGVGADCLVSSTDLTYESTGGSGMTTVASVTHTGYRRRGGGYHAESLPPLELRYSQAVIGREPRDVGPDALQNLPIGIDGTAYQWADLDGEGLSGVLARQGGAWFYKANLGGGRFAPQRMLATQPAMAAPGHRQELHDLAGDGHLDLVELGGPMPGFHERTRERGWRPFRPFRSHPDIAWDDPDLRMVDLDGDGLADVLITRDDAFTWYPSLGYEGYGRATRTFQPWDEERGPRLVLADPEQTIYLADMSGDGLSDLVRVRVGEVCYWPNTGFGRFGAKVTMDRCPWLDQPDHFDQRRVRLADVDGSGTADLVYLHPDGTRVYLNQSGNGYSDPHTLPHGFPRLDSLANVMVADLLGRGTACLVWSSPLPGDSGRQLRYIDLMAAGKPYLLTEMVNNLGAETQVSYAPSTQFYLADQAAGRPWITRLPFPVQVVERIATIDRINRNRFTTRRAYHHGYFDGFEREFLGFGMVETWDTEELAVLEADRTSGDFANLNPAASVPPVLTRAWLHTGVFPGEDRVSRLYARDYYRQPGGGDPDLPDTRLPGTLRLTGQPPRPWRLSQTEAREACRALKGMPLREEVYALDGTEADGRPYGVTEYNYTIELLQPALDPRPDGPQNYHAVLLAHPRETLTAHFERTLYPIAGERRADPRVGHDLVLAIDDYGNPLRSASVSYGRRFPDPALRPEDQEAQRRLRLTFAENRYTNAVELPGVHRTPLPCETRTFEIVGLHPGGQGLPPDNPLHDAGHRPDGGRRGTGAWFGVDELREGLAAIRTELSYQDWDADPAQLPGPARRLTGHTRVRYSRDDLAGQLPLGVLEPLALPYQACRLAFTGGLVKDVYGDRVGDRMLASAGYEKDEATWWIPSGQVFYSPDADDDADAERAFARRHFFLPRRFRDPYGNTTVVGYDRYDLLAAQTRDPLGNLVTAGERDSDDRVTSLSLDYRVLQPLLVSDPNRNRAAVAFDALGRVAGTAVMGKPEERLGDTLDGFDPDPTAEAVDAYFADPFSHAHRVLGRATTRVLFDLDAYQRTRGQAQPQPAGAAALARETHGSDLAPGQQTRIQHSFSYSDGFGREIQRKGQAAPGPVTHGGPAVEHRWIGSGWTVYNNKGQPVRSYEPFFTALSGFEFARAAGVSPVLFYDPPGRVVATMHPDHSYAKTVFDPWHQAAWDANDTVLLDPREDPDVGGYMHRYLAVLSQEPSGWQTWYGQRIGGQLGPAEQHAAEQTEQHADTPALGWFDALGRTFLAVAHNRLPRDGQLTDEFYRTRSELDIEGNLREVTDALGRAVMRYGYTITNDQVTRAGMDTGGGAMLPDVSGQPVRSWDSRGFAFRTDYDALRRPVRGHVRGPGLAGDVLQLRTVYGEALPGEALGSAERNLRTRVAVAYDNAGVERNVAYDFKGNLLEGERRLAADYRDYAVDWDGDVSLTTHGYTSHTRYDALNRPVAVTTPDGSVTIPGYNATSLLDRIEIRLRGASDATAFVTHLDYNARNQRILIRYGNGTHSDYDYDPLTFRLARLTTVRESGHLQDLRYTYDPAGNPTQVRDDAQQRVFFRNRVVEPSAHYRYDAIYQLIEASGREHLGQSAERALHPVPPGAALALQTGLPQPGDGAAMARYTERYSYDPVGNLLRVSHRTADPAQAGWTRDYRYREPSLLQPGRPSNRLTGFGPARSAGTPPRFGYDEQGNITAMPEIQVLRWDPQDRLHMTARQASAGDRIPAPTYYVYDGAGRRARKVTERAAGSGQSVPATERIYLGAFEIYREYGPGGAVALERETLHVLDGARRVALMETRTVGTDPGPGQLIRYQLADHLDSSVLELDQHAQVISYEEYYPYGATSYQAVRRQIEVPKRYRFTGKERDTETGLYYHGARYYIPWLGRWASCDPEEFANGTNPFRYCLNNPVKLTDADGRQAVPKVGSINGTPAPQLGMTITPSPPGSPVSGGSINGTSAPQLGMTITASPPGSPVSGGSINGVPAPQLGMTITASPPGQGSSGAPGALPVAAQNAADTDRRAPSARQASAQQAPAPGTAKAKAAVMPGVPPPYPPPTTPEPSGQEAQPTQAQPTASPGGAPPTGTGKAQPAATPPGRPAAQGQPPTQPAAGGQQQKKQPFLRKIKKFPSSEKAWTAKLVVVFGLLAALLIGLTMHFVPAASIIGRLFQVALPSLFVGLAANFAARDFTAQTPPTDNDRNPVDKWSWVHHLAGWVLGLLGVPFLLPFPVVPLLTVAWEVFEMSAAKFGMDEINANRITDITLAWAGWFLSRLLLSIH